MARRKASNRTRRLASKRDVAKFDREDAERKYKKANRKAISCTDPNSKKCLRRKYRATKAMKKVEKAQKRYDKADDRYNRSRRHDLRRWR